MPKIRDELMIGALDLGVFYEDVGGFGSSLITRPLGTYPLALVASPELRNYFPVSLPQISRSLFPLSSTNRTVCSGRYLRNIYGKSRSCLTTP